ncbi:tetratricopeptide repeat protein [Streptomyces olivaceus]|uniref:tetratricopeptide repeat protein n=1 Tax=Streptomyces olivaceus TaxID=47716 RepID=UPI001CCD31C4|nr:tetratricopeptide repeat protein [Streptomyces olivaceus]
MHGAGARVRSGGRESHNELSGTVHGPVVQAGSVHGGIHFGHTGPRPDGPERTPWQLPPLLKVIDRSRELAALERHRARAARDDRPVLAALSGLGGVGKTTLALSWLHALRSGFPDGQLHADLGAQASDGPAHPAEVLARFLRALGVSAQQLPARPAERTALYRSLTANRRLVVLLDDAVTAAQVRPLLPAGGSVTAVTSRRRLPGLTVDGCRPVHLEPLAPEAAVDLLADTLSDDRVSEQPDDARTLVELCAGLPLAVRVAGARLAARPGRPISTMVRALGEERRRLEALAIDGDHDVLATLDVSYRALPAPAARLYRLLGLHPGREFDGSVAAALLAADGGDGCGGADGPGGADGRDGADGGDGTDGGGGADGRGGAGRGAEDAAALLEALHDASLLVEAAGERHRFHDLVRLHAAAKAAEDEPPDARARALRRIADHCLASATRAEEILDPQHRTMPRDYGPGPVVVAEVGPGPEAALDWLERELPTLMAVLQQAPAAGFPTVCWQLADALWPLFLRRKFYPEWTASHRAGLAAAQALGDTAAECRMLTSGGVGELGSGSPGRALEMFERAARLFLAAGDGRGHARTLNYRGLALQRLGQPRSAADLFRRAATELPAHGDRRAGALAGLNLADLALDEGRAEEALRHAGAARGALAASGDTYNAARAATCLGRAHLALGRLEAAEEQLSEALAALRAPSAYEAARALGALAEVSERHGRRQLAADRCREALDLYASAGRSGSAGAEALRERLEQLERLERLEGDASGR